MFDEAAVDDHVPFPSHAVGDVDHVGVDGVDVVGHVGHLGHDRRGLSTFVLGRKGRVRSVCVYME